MKTPARKTAFKAALSGQQRQQRQHFVDSVLALVVPFPAWGTQKGDTPAGATKGDALKGDTLAGAHGIVQNNSHDALKGDTLAGAHGIVQNNSLSGAQPSTAASAGTAPVPAAELLQQLVDVAEAFPPEPFAGYLKSKGFDPEKGWVLQLPKALRAEFELPEFLPAYVRFDLNIKTHVFISNRHTDDMRMLPVEMLTVAAGGAQ